MKQEKRFVLGLVLFTVGTAILLLTFYYYWRQASLIGADVTTAISGTGSGFFVQLTKYIGAILGGALIIAAVYTVLTAL